MRNFTDNVNSTIRKGYIEVELDDKEIALYYQLESSISESEQPMYKYTKEKDIYIDGIERSDKRIELSEYES